MSAPFPWLVADIGGTNARFGWVAGPGRAVDHVEVLALCQHGSLVSAAQSYLGGLQKRAGPGLAAPKSAAFAIATTIKGDRIDLTNANWSFSCGEVERSLGLDVAVWLNDFEALALSLPELRADQLRVVPHLSPEKLSAAADGGPPKTGVLAVIGPGTGLGVAGVVHTLCGWVALPGEGGHATLAGVDSFEQELLAHARGEFPHISAERLLSGIGLPVLYRAMAATLGKLAALLDAQDIVNMGMARQCSVCERTLDAFCALLGSFAGNVALTLGARAGVYIGGGIVPRLGERFFTSRFRERFQSKGRFEAYLADIPTAVIIDTLAALGGARLALVQHRASALAAKAPPTQSR